MDEVEQHPFIGKNTHSYEWKQKKAFCMLAAGKSHPFE